MRKKLLSSALIAVMCGFAAPAQSAEDLLGLYKYLHANPELSLMETKTAALLAGKLDAMGFDVTEGVGGTGVVAVMKNGAGPTVMIRADMDGLPVKELTGLPYASKAIVKDYEGNEGPAMHACGHDIHMTVLIGTAEKLVAQKSDWSGTLVMILQPAEELGKGARDMLADGLFERFPRPNYNLALHDNSGMPAGKVGLVPGYALANVDSVDIIVRGDDGEIAHHFLLAAVLCRYVSGTPIASDDVSDARWFAIDAIAALPTSANVTEVIALAQAAYSTTPTIGPS